MSPLPSGLAAVRAHDPRRIPWLWGINGAFSVCASVLAVVIALGVAISAAYWTGCVAYAVAVAAFLRAPSARPSVAALSTSK